MKRWLAASSVLVAMLAADPARADDEAPATPAEPTAAADPVTEEARARVHRGLELYDEGEYRLALIELERANKILPSYKLLYNIGQVYMQLGQHARAHMTLRRYLADGASEIPSARRAEVEGDIATLAKRIAAVTVETTPIGAEVTLNDIPLGVAPVARTVVDAGSLRVLASKPGYVSQTRVLALAGGDDVAVRIDLVKVPTEAPRPTSEGLPPLALGGWIVTSVLAAGAIGTGIAASAAASDFDEMRRTPIEGSAAQARADLDRQGNLTDALKITTDALIVSSIVAGGISLWLTLRSRPTAPRSARMNQNLPLGFAF